MTGSVKLTHQKSLVPTAKQSRSSLSVLKCASSPGLNTLSLQLSRSHQSSGPLRAYLTRILVPQKDGYGARTSSIQNLVCMCSRGKMIDAIKIIEVMMGSLVTIYTNVFSLDYKREDESMFMSPLHSETQQLNDFFVDLR